MAMWQVSGAGGANYNGIYAEIGSYGGKPSYRLPDASAYLWWSIAGLRWVISPQVGDAAAYQSTVIADLPAMPWFPVGAPAPPPTVALYLSDVPAGELDVEITDPVEGADISGVYTVVIQVTFVPTDTYGKDVLVYLRVGRPGNISFIVLYDGSLANFEGVALIDVEFDTNPDVWTNGEIILAASAYIREYDYQGNAYDVVTCNINNAGSDPGFPPKVRFSSPAQLTTVSGLTEVSVLCTDPEGLALLAIDDEAANVTTIPIEGRSVAHTAVWDSTTVADGRHQLTATVTDTDALTGQDWLTLVVDNGPVGDVTDPVATILIPLTGASIAHRFLLRATGTDNEAIASMTAYIDGASQGLGEFRGNDTWEWEIDSHNFANGARVIMVTAVDTSGNDHSDSINVTFVNSIADIKRVLYTLAMPDGLEDVDFRDSEFILAMAVPDPNPDDIPSDPLLQMNVTCFVHIPGDSILLNEYQRIYPHRATRLVTQGTQVRFAMEATPRQVWVSWDTGSTACLAVAKLDDETIVGVCTTPHQIVRIDEGGDLSQFADLSGLPSPPTGMVAVGGKLLVSYADALAIYDQHDDELPMRIVFDETIASINAMSVGASGIVYLACTMDDSSGALYSFSYPIFTLLATHTDGLDAVLAPTEITATTGSGAAAQIWVGDDQGKVLYLSGDAFVEDYATGEAAVTTLWSAGATVYAGTASGGKLFRRIATVWSEVADFTWTAINAMATYEGWVYVVGTDAEIWREGIDGTFSNPFDLASTTAINHMLLAEAPEVVDVIGFAPGAPVDGGGAPPSAGMPSGPVDAADAVRAADQLYIACTGADAYIYRVELAPEGDLITGPEPPDFQFKILQDKDLS